MRVGAGRLERIVGAAERLKVKCVVSPECGHAYSALRWEGPNLIGRRYGFEVVQITELLDRFVRAGRLELRGKDARRLTFHDPCQLVRRGGLAGLDMTLGDLGGLGYRIVADPSTPLLAAYEALWAGAIARPRRRSAL